MSDDIRIDPATLENLSKANYPEIVRNAVYRLLPNEPAAALAIIGAFRDEASEFFTRRDQATAPEIKTFFASRRRDALDLVHALEGAETLALKLMETAE